MLSQQLSQEVELWISGSESVGIKVSFTSVRKETFQGSTVIALARHFLNFFWMKAYLRSSNIWLLGCIGIWNRLGWTRWRDRAQKVQNLKRAYVNMNYLFKLASSKHWFTIVTITAALSLCTVESVVKNSSGFVYWLFLWSTYRIPLDSRKVTNVNLMTNGTSQNWCSGIYSLHRYGRDEWDRGCRSAEGLHDSSKWRCRQ